MTTPPPSEPFDNDPDEPIQWGVEMVDLPEPQRELIHAIKTIKKAHPKVYAYLQLLHKKQGFRGVVELLERLDETVDKNAFELNPSETSVAYEMVNLEHIKTMLRRNLLRFGVLGFASGGLFTHAGIKLIDGVESQGVLNRQVQGKIESYKIGIHNDPAIAFEVLAGIASLAGALKLGYNALESDKAQFTRQAEQDRWNRTKELPRILAPVISHILETYRQKMGISDRSR
jgi:hypothetical protein